MDYKIDENFIKKKLESFYKLIDGKEEGDSDTRYKSWEYCYQAFADKRREYAKATEKEREKIVDFLSLHLGFYLASWGMYRGSSYLLQRDYKTHKKTVRILLEEQYACLWGYAPQKSVLQSRERSVQNELLFDGEKGLYGRIKTAYIGRGEWVDDSLLTEEGDGDVASDTLVTKILLGALGCIPAFDRFLKRGIKWLKQFDGYKRITQTIENGKASEGKTFALLECFACANEGSLVIDNPTVRYPVMKCLDMFLWQIGYEYDLIEGLKKEKNEEKKRKILSRAQKLGVCISNDYASAVAEIEKGLTVGV